MLEVKLLKSDYQVCGYLQKNLGLLTLAVGFNVKNHIIRHVSLFGVYIKLLMLNELQKYLHTKVDH